MPAAPKSSKMDAIRQPVSAPPTTATPPRHAGEGRDVLVGERVPGAGDGQPAGMPAHGDDDAVRGPGAPVIGGHGMRAGEAHGAQAARASVHRQVRCRRLRALPGESWPNGVHGPAVGCSPGTAGAAPAAGLSPGEEAAPALRRSSSRIKWMTALIKARWEKACGKFPR